MIEVFCSSLQLTMNHSKQHLSTFPLTSKVTNTQMCGLFPPPLPSRFCVAMCLCSRCKQHSLQSELAGTEGSLALREPILQILENCVPCKGQYYITAEKLQFQEILSQSSCVVLLPHLLSFMLFCFIPGFYTATCLNSQLNGSGSYTGTTNLFMWES